MTFSEILGQQDAKQLLSNAIKNKKTSHAYILDGEDGSGKMMLAEAFATMLLCENPADDACCQCHSCQQAISHNNPDIVYVTHEKPNIISVDDIRSQINDDIVLKPYARPYKVYIVDEAEKMNQQAQNALLKTIEEPPSYAIIILLTNNANSFLQTIISRCVTIHMKPVDDSVIQKVLLEKYGVVDYQAQIISTFAQGNVGKAIGLAASEEFNNIKSEALGIVKRMDTMDIYQIDEAVKLINEKKQQIADYLDLFTLWYRDVLLYKATCDEKTIRFKEELFTLRSQSEAYSYRSLDIIFQEIARARDNIKANVNFELTVELLLLSMKENYK